MNISEIKRLPASLRFGGTPLNRDQIMGKLTTEEILVRMELGVRRVNDDCIELESYANQVKGGTAFVIGFSMVAAISISVLFWSITPPPITFKVWMMVAFIPWLGVLMAVILYLGYQSVLGHNRGTFIRLHRGTRKVYFVAPGQTHLHALDWDGLEVRVGYVPIVSQAGYTSRYPLYLIGVDSALPQPTEVCIACGNLGFRDEGQSATQLWDYLQHFMARGPHGLTHPGPLPPRLSRKQTFLQPFRDWHARLRERLAAPGGWLRAPLTVPLQVGWLLINVFPDALAEVIQYNLPYTPFPDAIDMLCGFDSRAQG